jgi:hypothetical membrane protein
MMMMRGMRRMINNEELVIVGVHQEGMNPHHPMFLLLLRLTTTIVTLSREHPPPRTMAMAM